MKEVKFTIVKKVIKGGDSFAEITALGFNKDDAKLDALRALKYAGSHAEEAYYFSANGIEIPEGKTEDDIAEAQGWEYSISMEYEGKRYAFAPNYDEYLEGDVVSNK